MAKRTCSNGHVTKDDKALKCSQCGVDLPPVPKRSKLPLIIGLVVVLGICGVIGMAMQGGGKSSTQTASQQIVPTPQQKANASGAAKATDAPADSQGASQDAAPTEAPQPTKTPVPLPSIGADVKVNDVAWKVLAAKNLGQLIKSNNQFIDDAKTSGSFIQVRYQVTNNGSSETYYQTPDLLDAGERKFGSSSNTLFLIPNEEQCALQKLNPGISKTCQEIYEVPADAKALVAKLTGMVLFSDSTNVDLGLGK